MTNLLSSIPSLKLTATPSSSQSSYYALNTSVSPTKLSEYLKDRSVSRCKELVRMMSADSSPKLNQSKAKILPGERYSSIQNLSQEIIRELISLKEQTKKSRDEEQLTEAQNTLRSCLNLLKGVKEQDDQDNQDDGRSFLQTQIEGILKSKNQKEPYKRERRNSGEMSSIRSLGRCSINYIDSIVQKPFRNIQSSSKKMVPNERKSWIDRNQ